MRNILGKLTAGSFVAGAALLVAACGGGDTGAGESNNLTDFATGNTADQMAVDGMANGTDANMMGTTGDTTGTTTGSTTDTGTSGTDSVAPATGNSSGGNATDSSSTDVGGDTGGEAGEAINGM